MQKSLFKVYLEMVHNLENTDSKKQFILDKIKNANEKYLLEIAESILDDIEDYDVSDKTKNTDPEKLRSDVIATVEKAAPEEINDWYSLLK